MGQFKHERTGDSLSNAQRSSEMRKQFKHICLAVSFFVRINRELDIILII